MNTLLTISKIMFYFIGSIAIIVYLNFGLPKPQSKQDYKQPTITKETIVKQVQVIKHQYIDPNLIGLTAILILTGSIGAGFIYAFKSKTTKPNDIRIIEWTTLL